MSADSRVLVGFIDAPEWCDGFVAMERLNALVGPSHGLEEGVWREDDFELALADPVNDMKQSVSQVDAWSIFDEKHGVQTVGGQNASPENSREFGPQSHSTLLTQVTPDGPSLPVQRGSLQSLPRTLSRLR